MSFPKYPAYKDSGVEWIGEIPVGWKIGTIKNGYQVTLGKMLSPKQNSSDSRVEMPYLRAANVQDGFINSDDVKTMLFSQSEISTLSIATGDVLVCEGGDVGRSVFIEKDIARTGFQNSLNRIRSKHNSTKYFYYFSRFVKTSGYLDMLCNKSTISHYTFEKLSNTPFAYPPLPEQQAIASFLDRECGKIDVLIAEQERLIALLAEKRQAVISHAVTKGLNPTAPMKDSGVEWIGEIPVGWEVKSLRFALSDIFNGSTATQVEPSNDTIAVTRIETISGGKINLEKVGYINKAESEERKILKNGDIIFSNINSLKMIGNCAIFYGDFLLHSGMNLITLRPNSSVYPKFIIYVLKSTLCREEIESRAKPAINQASISQQSICDIKIPDIPLPEQQAIASFLDRECGRIDALVEEQKAMVALCKERRAALISAAVTGKIDVRAQSKALAA